MLMMIYFYVTYVDYYFCVLENIFANIPKVVIFVLYKNSEEYFKHYNFIVLAKAQKFLKNILEKRVLRNLATSLSIFYFPTFLLKYSEREFF